MADEPMTWDSWGISRQEIVDLNSPPEPWFIATPLFQPVVTPLSLLSSRKKRYKYFTPSAPVRFAVMVTSPGLGTQSRWYSNVLVEICDVNVSAAVVGVGVDVVVEVTVGTSVGTGVAVDVYMIAGVCMVVGVNVIAGVYVTVGGWVACTTLTLTLE